MSRRRNEGTSGGKHGGGIRVGDRETEALLKRQSALLQKCASRLAGRIDDVATKARPRANSPSRRRGEVYGRTRRHCQRRNHESARSMGPDADMEQGRSREKMKTKTRDEGRD